MSTPYLRAVANALASAFLAPGPWTVGGLALRARRSFGERRRWQSLARAVLARYPTRADVQARELARFVRSRGAFGRATTRALPPLRIRRWLLFEPAMGVAAWPVPPLATAGALATWLGLTGGELDWLADERALERLPGDEPLRHYRYAWLAKRGGGHRLLEAPKPRLRAVQRRILREILDVVPPHDAAHGFRAGRSALTHARAHEGRAVVVRLDLTDFFPSVGSARVRALFRGLGYPDDVAHLLACLVTNVAAIATYPPPPLPRTATHVDVEQRHEARVRAWSRHLPQGAPSSPAIANLCAYRLDVRLTALAAKMDAMYTRYADDLVFSGDETFARQASFTVPLAAAIAGDEGFVVNHRKTRVMTRAARQLVTGLVVNHRARVSRAEYDALRALLHNCARTGLDAQNRAGHPDLRRHLEGRIAWVSSGDERRGAKLAALLAQIAR